MKIVTILDNESEVIGRMPLDVACKVEDWDYETTNFGLDFGVMSDDQVFSRERRRDQFGFTKTMEWKIGDVA